MALRLSARTQHRSLLRSSKDYRAIRYSPTPPSTRTFSASSRRPLANEILLAPNLLLDGIHNLGAPWYLAIPTLAVLVRGVVVYNLVSKPRRAAAQKRSNLVPLALATASRKTTQLRHDAIMRGIPQAKVAWQLIGFFNYQRSIWKLSKDYGCWVFSPSSFANLGFLIMFSEVIRLKCNASSGLWPTIMAPFEWIATRFSGGATNPADTVGALPPKTELDKMVEELERWREQQIGTPGQGHSLQAASTVGQEPIADSIPATVPTLPPATEQASPLFDPSLTLDGLPWCADLTATDPYFILPAILGASLFASVLSRRISFGRLPNADGPTLPASARRWYRMDRPLNTFERILLSFNVILTMAATQWPAALLLYFIPSVTVGWLQQKWLDRKMPIIPPISPLRKEAAHLRTSQWQLRVEQQAKASSEQ